jgi:hypothetical protein
MLSALKFDLGGEPFTEGDERPGVEESFAHGP